MSGHSKWSTIKRQKGAADQKRGALFSRLSKNILLAIKKGGPDEKTNTTLRLAIAQAKQSNMPKDNIQRLIDKAKGGDAASLEESTYEGYGPGGSALIIEITTDNKNRAVSEIKNTLSKNDGKLGENGSAIHLFQKVGQIAIEKVNIKDSEKIELMLMDIGAEDILNEEEGIIAFFSLENFSKAIDALENKNIKNTAEVIFKPYQELILEERKKQSLDKLVNSLSELDDVNNVFSNASE